MILLFKRILTTAVSLAILAGSSAAQGSPAQAAIAQYQNQFKNESNPVRRAKLMAKLGRAEFDLIRKDLAAGDYEAAVKVVKDYETEAAEVQKGLDSTGIDAEKNPSGFKEFQIAVRESIDRLNDVLTGMTGDEQPPFGHARKELESIDHALIQRLFPRQPKAEAEHGKATPQ
jgi:hypothetical protein